ncbi:unnamed protein product [Brassica rapa]|uniref:Uncharacterized protein n=1 Tax=Brassica campestris TaxID=3711 RepID=A0A3P5YFM2_BRACM|nr:unnamed protein product [Brassica rapa]VDC60290.1 unnamed protein product [Brassica rapa]
MKTKTKYCVWLSFNTRCYTQVRTALLRVCTTYHYTYVHGRSLAMLRFQSQKEALHP